MAMATATEEVLAAFTRALPKIELHAHLHGSIRSATLEELVLTSESGCDAASLRILRTDERSLDDCFAIFRLIHGAVRDAGALRRITAEALEDFAADNVCYCELRSTPRALPDGTSRREYALTVLEAMRDYEERFGGPETVLASLHTRDLAGSGSGSGSTVGGSSSSGTGGSSSGGTGGSINGGRDCGGSSSGCHDCGGSNHGSNNSGACDGGGGSSSDVGSKSLIPRLLLSVDRAGAAEDAEETVALALELQRDPRFGHLVVGMDLSGHPGRGSFAAIRPALEAARRGGLKVTVHCGESGDDVDTAAILDFMPDRLGHFVLVEEEAVQRLLALPKHRRPPIEVCPTSNLLTLRLNGHHEHPLAARWIREGYPFSVNTDDAGVFATSLSAEFASLAAAQNLSLAGVAALATGAAEHIFDKTLREALLAACQNRCARLLEGRREGEGGLKRM